MIINILFRHVGDLGNVEERSDGTVAEQKTDRVASLYGDQTILGRAIVVSVTIKAMFSRTDYYTTGGGGGLFIKIILFFLHIFYGI